MVEQAAEILGSSHSGCAGVAPLMEYSEEAGPGNGYQSKGNLFCTQAAAKYMLEQKYGKIINIGSAANGQSHNSLSC